MGTHLRVLCESYPMNTNMTVLIVFKNLFILMLWIEVASALEGLNAKRVFYCSTIKMQEPFILSSSRTIMRARRHAIPNYRASVWREVHGGHKYHRRKRDYHDITQKVNPILTKKQAGSAVPVVIRTNRL